MCSSSQLSQQWGFGYLYTQLRRGETEGACVHAALFYLACSQNDCVAQKDMCMKEAALQAQQKREYLWLCVKSQSLCWAALAARSILSRHCGAPCSCSYFWAEAAERTSLQLGYRDGGLHAVLKGGWAVGLYAVLNPYLPFLGICKYRTEVIFSMTVITVIHCAIGTHVSHSVLLELTLGWCPCLGSHCHCSH